MSPAVQLRAVPGLAEIVPGTRLGEEIAAAAQAAGILIDDQSVVVISQKVVSKAEGRTRALAGIEPGAHALDLGATLGKDPRLVELILAESRRIVRAERGVLICETHSGLICANAGVDASNVQGADRVTLLPLDPDLSARRLRAEIRRAVGPAPAVVVADSFGRPWRRGQADIVIGCAGLDPIQDWRGQRDREGRELTATVVAAGDQIAAAADLARDKVSGEPVIVVSGVGRFVTAEDGPGAASLVRPAAEDLFR
jgi:coenzyme F420-0:L-glutamate ligase / coenzyme F420-1:gamma-L-glutamate ligase